MLIHSLAVRQITAYDRCEEAYVMVYKQVFLR
jgi:hypothetical protein